MRRFARQNSGMTLSGLFRHARLSLLVPGLALLGACGGGAGPETEGPFTLSGTIQGTSAGTIKLANSGEVIVVSPADGRFRFPTPLAAGAPYEVTVADGQVIGARCAVQRGKGIARDDVGDVQVDCVRTYSLHGRLLAPGPIDEIVLVNGDATVIRDRFASSAFTFPVGVAGGETYDVRVAQQPTGMTCTVNGGTGVMPAGDALVEVRCATNPAFPVGGTVTGLARNATVLLANSAIVGASGVSSVTGRDDPSRPLPFSFGAPVVSGVPYTVTVAIQPLDFFGQACRVSNGANGVVAGAPVADIRVDCGAVAPFLAGIVSGLNAAGLVLGVGAEQIALSPSASSFTTTAPLAPGSTWELVVLQQPAGLTCSVSGTMSGAVTGALVRNLAVFCDPQASPLGGRVVGLTQPGLTLAAAGQVLVVQPGATNFSFAPVARRTRYDVEILRQPTGLVCGLLDDKGTVADGPVANVSVACRPESTVITGSNVTLSDTGSSLHVATDGSTYYATGGTLGRVRADGVHEFVVDPAFPSAPLGIVTDASGNLYVSGPDGIRRRAADGTWSDFVARRGAYLGGLAIDASAGVLYATGWLGGESIERWRLADGTALGSLRLAGGQTFGGHIALDRASGDLYVRGAAGLMRVASAAFAGTGPVILEAPPFSAAPGEYGAISLIGAVKGWPGNVTANGLATDAAGNLYVAATESNQVMRFDAPVRPGSTQFVLAGSGGEGLLDGPSSVARFRFPYSLAVGAGGDVMVGERGGRLRRVIVAK